MGKVANQVFTGSGINIGLTEFEKILSSTHVKTDPKADDSLFLTLAAGRWCFLSSRGWNLRL